MDDCNDDGPRKFELTGKQTGHRRHRREADGSRLGGQLTALPTGLTALWVWVWKKAEFASGLCRTRQRRVGMLHLHWAQRTGAHMPPPGTQERPALLSWNPSLVVWVWSEEAASGEAPAALGCSIEGGGGGCFWEGSRCAGLHD